MVACGFGGFPLVELLFLFLKGPLLRFLELSPRPRPRPSPRPRPFPLDGPFLCPCLLLWGEAKVPKPELLGYTDAGYLSDPHKARSQSGYVFTCGNTAISWRSVKKTVVAYAGRDGGCVVKPVASHIAPARRCQVPYIVGLPLPSLTRFKPVRPA